MCMQGTNLTLDFHTTNTCVYWFTTNMVLTQHILQAVDVHAGYKLDHRLAMCALITCYVLVTLHRF